MSDDNKIYTTHDAIVVLAGAVDTLSWFILLGFLIHGCMVRGG